MERSLVEVSRPWALLAHCTVVAWPPWMATRGDQAAEREVERRQLTEESRQVAVPPARAQQPHASLPLGRGGWLRTSSIRFEPLHRRQPSPTCFRTRALHLRCSHHGWTLLRCVPCFDQWKATEPTPVLVTATSCCAPPEASRKMIAGLRHVGCTVGSLASEWLTSNWGPDFLAAA